MLESLNNKIGQKRQDNEPYLVIDEAQSLTFPDVGKDFGGFYTG